MFKLIGEERRGRKGGGGKEGEERRGLFCLLCIFLDLNG